MSKIPTVYYHRTIAIEGECFDLSSEPEEKAIELEQLEQEGWVDTPAKFEAQEKAEQEAKAQQAKAKAAADAKAKAEQEAKKKPASPAKEKAAS